MLCLVFIENVHAFTMIELLCTEDTTFVAFDRKLVHYEGRFHASLSGLCWVVLLHCLF